MEVQWLDTNPGWRSPSFFLNLPDSEEFPFLGFYDQEQLLGYTRIWKYSTAGVVNFGNQPFSGSLVVQWRSDSTSKLWQEALLRFLKKEVQGGRIHLYFPGKEEVHFAGFKAIHKPTFLLDLNQDVWEGIHPKRKNVIRKLEKDEKGEVREQVKWDPRFYSAFIPSSDMEALKRYAPESGSWMALEGMDGENQLGGAVGAQEGDTVKYILGGAQRGHAYMGSAVLWALISRAKQNGFRTFDFEGSSIPGVHSFFKSFGGNEVQVHGVEYLGWKAKMMRSLKQLIGRK